MPGTQLAAEALAGAWRLVDWTVRRLDGSTAQPLGPRPIGLLVYTADGQVSGQMLRPDRARLRRSRASAADVDSADDPAELAAAFNGYVAYFGTYHLDPVTGTVCHQVEGALIPNWEGAELVRQAVLDGDRLVLRTPPVTVGDATQSGTLTWERS